MKKILTIMLVLLLVLVGCNKNPVDEGLKPDNQNETSETGEVDETVETDETDDKDVVDEESPGTDEVDEVDEVGEVSQEAKTLIEKIDESVTVEAINELLATGNNALAPSTWLGENRTDFFKVKETSLFEDRVVAEFTDNHFIYIVDSKIGTKTAGVIVTFNDSGELVNVFVSGLDRHDPATVKTMMEGGSYNGHERIAQGKDFVQWVEQGE